MIYTVGKTDAYERYFREQGTPTKLGRTEGYEGGIAFKTQSDALQYLRMSGLDSTYSVYGLLADWDTDTASTEFNHRSLLTDSPLVRLQPVTAG